MAGGSGNITNPTAKTVTTTATLLAGGRGSREGVLIQNRGSTAIFIGGSDVTAATGIEVAPGATYSEEFYSGALYGITSSGSSTDVRVQEVY